jgi:hypothetical protein
MADTSPERQAYGEVVEEGYKGRFASNTANIRLFKDNPYIKDLANVEALNLELLDPYNGELFHDDDGYIYYCRVSEDENTGIVTRTYISREKMVDERLKSYESKGAINQMMSAYNNGQIYKFYYNTNVGLMFPNSSLVFPEHFDHYKVRKHELNINNEKVYVVGAVDATSGNNVFSTSMQTITDTVNNTTYKRMNPGKIFVGVSNTGTEQIDVLENGKFYVVEFYDRFNVLVDTYLFQAVESSIIDTQVPSEEVVDLKIIVYRNGADLKSGSNVYQIYAGEDLSRSVSYAVVAIYNNGTEKVISDKLDTAQLSRTGWDVNTSGAPEGKKFEVSFTYYPVVTQNGEPIGAGITRSVFFQVTSYPSAKIVKCLPVVWSDDNDVDYNNVNGAKTFKLKVYTLSSDGVLDNRTRSFYNTMKVNNGLDEFVNVDNNVLPAVYAFDPYNQCILFTFLGNATLSEKEFQFSMYNSGIETPYRFKINFAASDGKYVNASIVNGYGYAEGDVFDRFSDDYVRTNKKNSATVANNIFSNIEITLSIAEDDTYIREKYARTINGVKYRPNRVTLYSTKDTTFTDLNYQSVINISDTSVLVTPIGDAAVSTVISQLNTNDYILALFRYDDGSSSKVINIGAFQVVMNVNSL